MYNVEWFLKKFEKTMRKSKVLQDVFKTIAAAITNADDEADEVAKQIRPSTATIIIDEWEKDFGMTPRTGYDIRFRQETLLAKEKGQGVITLEVIKNTAESFSGVEVEVASNTDENLIFVKFIGTVGIPENLEELKEAIDDIIPAHMEPDYEFIYNTHEVLSSYPHDVLAQFTHEELRGAKIEEKLDNTVETLRKYTVAELSETTVGSLRNYGRRIDR